MNKKALPVEENCGEELNCCMAIGELEESLTDVPDSTTSTERNDSRDVRHVDKNSVTGNLIVDHGSQTVFCKYTLSSKVDTMILGSEVALSKPQAPKIVSSMP